MNKRTKQILAIVSIILSVAIVVGIVLFVLASCGNGGTTTTKKKKKKVVIVKKPTTTQTDETSSEEDTDENVYDTDNEYKEDETPVVDEEPADEPTKEPEEEVVKPVYEVDLEKVIYNPLNERIGMAVYHMEEGQWDDLLGNKYAKEEEFIS